MRIAQIAPLYERVRLYGGTERVVSFLTEELVRQGHDVTLFASGDTQTSAKLVGCCEMALRLNPAARDALPYHMIMLDDAVFGIRLPRLPQTESGASSRQLDRRSQR